MENIDEKSMYTELITLALIDLKMFSQAIDTLEEQLKEPKDVIALVLSKKKVEDVLIKVMQKEYNALSKINIRLEILKNKIAKDEKVIKPYFKNFNDYKDEYIAKKTEVLKQIKKYQLSINTLMMKAGIYVEENTHTV